jgi:hypothetical protein
MEGMGVSEDARDWADETPKLRHRCGWPDYYGCRICMNRDDEEAPNRSEEPNMIASHTRQITVRGWTAKPVVGSLSVIRNDGYCWGRIVLPSGRQLDVSSGETDLYDLPDEDALDIFEELAEDADNVEEAVGWL